jgi:hypothetical protein
MECIFHNKTILSKCHKINFRDESISIFFHGIKILKMSEGEEKNQKLHFILDLKALKSNSMIISWHKLFFWLITSCD